MNKFFRKIVILALIFAGLACSSYFLYRSISKILIAQSIYTDSKANGLEDTTINIKAYPNLKEYAKNPTTKVFLRKIEEISPEQFNNHLLSLANAIKNDEKIQSEIMIRESSSFNLLDNAFYSLIESDSNLKEFIQKNSIMNNELASYKEALKKLSSKKLHEKDYKTALAAIKYVSGDIRGAKKIAETVSAQERDSFIFGMAILDVASTDFEKQDFAKTNHEIRKAARVFIQNILNEDKKCIGERCNSILFLQQCAMKSRLTATDDKIKNMYLNSAQQLLEPLIPLAKRINWTQVLLDYSRTYGEKGDLKNCKKYTILALEASKKEDIADPTYTKNILKSLIQLETILNKNGSAQKLQKE